MVMVVVECFDDVVSDVAMQRQVQVMGGLLNDMRRVESMLQQNVGLFEGEFLRLRT